MAEHLSALVKPRLVKSRQTMVDYFCEIWSTSGRTWTFPAEARATPPNFGRRCPEIRKAQPKVTHSNVNPKPN